MIDLYLKAENETKLNEYLTLAGFEKTESGWYKEGSSLFVIGELSITVGEGEFAVVEPLEGFHANLRTVDTSVFNLLKPLSVQPKTPQYVWAT